MRTVALFALISAVGCAGVKPVGPLASSFDWTTPQQKAADAAKAAPPEPVVKAARRPSPPSVFVSPGEVNAMNADDMARRLTQELEADRRAID